MHNVTQPILPGLQPAGTGPVIVTHGGIAVGSLSPQEAAHYPSLFKVALGAKAIQTSTSIPASAGASFLKRSGLTTKQLHDIWVLADSEDAGFLSPNGFYKACRLVAHIQSGKTVVSEDLLATEPQILPYFEGSEGSEEGIWNMTETEIHRYADLYRREGGLQKMDGSDARALLLKSGLSSSELCDIWDLGDVDKDGKLTFGEFLVVMQLVSKVRDGKAFVPDKLPQTLSEYLTRPLPSGSTPSVPLTLASPSHVTAPELSPSSARPFGSIERPVDARPVANIGFGAKEPETPKFAEPASLLEKELATEQQALAHTVGKRKEFRKQVLEARSRLESLRQEAKKVEIELVAADKQVERVQDQILAIQSHITEAEDDLETFRRQVGEVNLPTGGDAVAAVAAIRESIGEDEREVLELRAQLERIQREKVDLQSKLSVLQEKKRIADQDRNMIIAGLENDRAKLVTVRAERLKLWEQRHQLTRELTTKTFDQLNVQRSGGQQLPSSGVIPNSAAAIVSPVRPAQPSRDRKGVRADAPMQTSSSSPTFQMPPMSNSLSQWNKFGVGESFNDPLAGAFDSGEPAVTGADSPQFGSA